MTSELRDQLQATLGGAYTIERELMGGGMSRMFVALETALGRRVVIKVLPPEMAAGVSVERFKREIQVAAQLQHPHLVPVLAAGQTDGLPYYTMPFVEGQSLRARLAVGEQLPINETIGILRDVGKALAFAHEHGVVHRDIKPDNVLLTGGSAVVADFGIAKAVSAARAHDDTARLTQTGSSIGTPAYMAPEQIGAGAVDHRADLYAFGVMAYEMLAGRPPFRGLTPQKLLAAQLSELPVAIGILRPNTPALLAELITRCLEKEPDRRPPAATSLVHMLESLTSAASHTALLTDRQASRPRLVRVLVFWAAASIGIVGITSAAVIAIGLPDWVVPGAILVMLLGIPVILFTAFVSHSANAALTSAALPPAGQSNARSMLTQLAVKVSPWVSWRSTTIGGVAAMAVFALFVFGFMILRALGIGPAGSLLAAGELRERERLLIADFRVGGTDTSLGSIATEAIRTDLSQSSSVSIVAPSVVAGTLARMRRSDTSHVDLALAREIATREGIKAIVDGDVRPLGDGFVVNVRLVAADSGNELAAFRETAEGPAELIRTLEKVARRLRGKIGESLRSVRATPALEQVTTSSLEALRKYIAGARANDQEGDFAKAVRLLQEAVALDTGFAMAYRKLGTARANAGMARTHITEAVDRAYQLRHRLTERERLLTTATFFSALGSGMDRQQAAAAFEALLDRDSLDAVAMNNLGELLMGLRQFSRAEALFRRAIASGRAGVIEYTNLVWTKINLGQLAAAESTMAATRAAYPLSPRARVAEVSLLYAQGRLGDLEAQISRMRSDDPAVPNRAQAANWLGDLAMLRGRLSVEARMRADARVQNAARGALPTPLTQDVEEAFRDIWFRDRQVRGVQTLEDALARTPLRSLPPNNRPYLRIATLFARGGRPDQARAVLTEFSSDLRNTSNLRAEEPARHNVLAEIALAEGRPLDAINEFRLGDSLPDGPVGQCAPCVYASLGRAFDLARARDSAIVSFERYLATPFAFKLDRAIDPTYRAAIHKRLGDLYAASGDRRMAAGHYVQFVDLWRTADPELQPKVEEARRRLEVLRRGDATVLR